MFSTLYQYYKDNQIKWNELRGAWEKSTVCVKFWDESNGEGATL